MPLCPLCPDRSFKDDNAVRMHRESKHPYACGECSKILHSQNALEQHTRDKHSFFECEYCDREFATDEARLAHQNAKHQSMFECHYCDREFTTPQGRDAHEGAKHPIFECNFCDKEFSSEEAAQQHEDAKHRSTFECHYCDREFSSEQALQQHEDSKHPTIECHYCDREFNSEDARSQHEDAVHLPFECHHCTREFTSEVALQQHENAKHCFECKPCGKSFECNYCTTKFPTQDSKNAHEEFCSFNPTKRVTCSVRASSKEVVLDTPHCTDEGSESSATPSHSLNLTLDEGKTLHSANGTSSASTPGKVQPCASSNTDEPIPGDAGSVVSTNNKHQDGSVDLHDVVFQCTSCLKVLENGNALRDHVCIIRPHCPMCYTQFDDELLFHKHLDGFQSLSCHFCPTRCCSNEMLQDHLLTHPMCGKCGSSFADNLALCAHVESSHPVVVCWDCDGIVVENDNLEMHYAESSAHPSCAFCGLGKRNLADMDEHIKHMHALGAEMKDHLKSDNICAHPDIDESPLAEKQPPGAVLEEATREVSNELSHMPASAGRVSGSDDELHNSPLQAVSLLASSSQPPIPSEVGRIHEVAANSHIIGVKQPSDVDVHRYSTPSPTPSEQGSDASRLRMVASEVISTTVHDDSRFPTRASSVSEEPLSDTSTQSSPMSSSHSIVFVSADGIPDYVRDNRAVLVATSAGSPSSGCTPLRLSSSSSLESLGIVDPVATYGDRAPTRDDATVESRGDRVALRLHCRICLKDPCDDMTATLCGHLFCKRCITQAVLAKSECPVCQNATLLYCLFKLDLCI